MKNVNSHAVGYAGLAIGAGSIIGSIAGFFRLVSDPTYLDALFVLAMHAHRHAMTAADTQTLAQLCAAFLAIVGAFVVALLASYFGRPVTVPGDSVASGAAQAPTTPPGEKEKP